MHARTRRSAPFVALLAAAALSACGSAPTASDPAPSDPAPSNPVPSSPSVPSAPSSASSTLPASPSSAAPSAGQSMSGSPIQAPSSTPAMVTVPVYYVLRTPQGRRLVQEPTPVPADNKVAGAAQALMQAPKDPDYTSFYHAGDLGDAHYAGGTFTAVETNHAIATAGSLSPADAALAVQQLVYTLEAAQGTSNAPVKVVANGSSTPLFGVSTAQGVTPASQLRTLADINLLAPAQGSTQSGSVLASGLANSPEANVIWKITDARGTVVRHGYATAAGWMDKLYPWHTKITISGLPAGTYTLTASTDNEADGGEGAGATSDTKAFTVS